MSDSRKGRRQRGCKLLGRELRIRRGHRSYAEMARMAKLPPLVGRVEPVSGSYLHKIEQGERIPSVEKLRTLSMLYGMSVEHMIRLIESEKLASIEPTGESVEETLEEARQAISLGDYRTGFSLSLWVEQRVEDEELRADAKHDKAVCLWKLGMPKAAAEEMLEVLELPAPRIEKRLYSYHALASIFRSLNFYTAAEGFARLGLEEASSTREPLAHAALHSILGNILSDRAEQAPDGERRQRRAREAIRHLEKARDGFQEAGSSDQAAITLSNLGLNHRIEGNLLLAFKLLRQGLEEARAAQSQWGIAFTQKELGRTYLAAGEWKEAKRALAEAERASGRSGYTDIQFQALVHLTRGAQEAGENFVPMLRRLRGLLPYLEDRFPERDWFEENLAELRAAEGGAS